MNTEKIRRGYLPDAIRVLFVGESPPAGGTFFYLGNSNLARYTADGFSRAYKTAFPTPRHFLSVFKNLGCYLEDLCEHPVNHLGGRERRKAHAEAVPILSHRLSEFSPKAIISVVGSISPHVVSAMDSAGLLSAPYFKLPFPAMGHQHRYVEELSNVLMVLRNEKILSKKLIGAS